MQKYYTVLEESLLGFEDLLFTRLFPLVITDRSLDQLLLLVLEVLFTDGSPTDS